MSSITISTTNTYPVFESNQVLTSSQLNQLLDYLDRQSRFTRSKLIGIGIVCGMQVKYQPEEQAPILISKGVGVTSDGFVINVPECPVRYIRNYLLPEGVDYKPFGCFDENDLYYQDVNLYELLVKEPDDPTGVTEIDTDTDFLDDKYVVMFLECFDRDFKSCLGKNCDENGKERIFTLRKLLISQADLDKVLLRSDGLGNPYVDQEILPTVAMPRPIFLPEENHSQQYVDFAEHYRDLLAGTYVELFGSSETDGILPETYTQYEPVLGAHYNYINPIESSTIDALKDTWRAYYTEADTSLANYLSGIQHFYDFLKDVVLAYDEFRKAAYDLISECCPSRSFPLHLMLGKVIYDDGQLKETDEFDVCSPFNYRHTFLQPEIFNGQKHLKNTVINLHKRLVLMLENFNLDTILNSGDQMIKTTPSNEKLAPLADRSIPYYYDINTNGTVKGVSTIDLEKSWNFDARRRGCPGGVEIVSYTKNDVTQDTHQDPITTPLLYNLDGHPFFRIEGHFGKAYTDVQTELEDLKKRFNLSFDVTAVKLDTTTGSIVLDDCYWDDQQAAYSAARSEMICVVNNLNAQWTDFVNEWNAWLPGSELPGVGLNTTFDVINIDVINEILALLPTKISDFDFGAFKGVYDKLQFDLGAYLLSAQHTFNSLIQEKSGVISLSTLEEALSMLNAGIHASNAFYSNCTYIKLFTQYHNYVALLAYMQENHWSVFSNFIKTHPGIDHQIGVPKGGTFLLVYKGDESETTNQVIADFTLPYTCCDTCPDIPGAEDLEVTYPPSARPEMIITTVNQDVIIDVKANDLDINVENLRITEKGSEAGGDSKSAQGGDVLFNDGRRFLRYVPPNNFTGEDQFQYTIDNEDSGLTDTTFVRVLVVDPYTPHIKAVGDLAATDSATSILIEVTNNDTFYGTTQVLLPLTCSDAPNLEVLEGNTTCVVP
ncbi:MAG: Ig-like domain-containing protein [Bacteroidota bacterium]